MKTLGWTRGYSDGDVDTNNMGNRTLESMAAERFSRRQTLMGSLKATAMAFLGTGLLAACDDDDDTGGSPVVSIGNNATTSAGRMVTLTAAVGGNSSGSTAAWRQTGGPAVTLMGNGTNATFIAPAVATATPLTFAFSATGSNGLVGGSTSTVTVNPATLGFTAVPKNRLDIVTVPIGYSVTVLTALGDPIAAGVAAYANDGTDGNFNQRIGDHGDALYYYGLSESGARDDNSSTRGLLVQNHENLNVQYLHPNGPTNLSGGPRPAAEAIKEIEAHGVSVTEYRDTGNRQWTYVQNSPFNRRLTPNTPMSLHGPVRGTSYVRTAYSNDGTQGRGTINNCANGATHWGTMLTCEENWAGYFRRPNTGAASDNTQRSARELTALRRYGVNSSTGNYAWSSVDSNDPMFRKWDARAIGASALEDYRNEPNQYGWVVELDPYDPNSMPRKRTALGRMGHEGAWLSRQTAGQKVAIYMGDDARREYLYKFVSDATWSDGDAQSANRMAMGDKYLDAGTLYAARFDADGTGTWLPLVFGQVPNRPAVGAEPEYVFADQADILINCRLAADAVGATPMDRPEWTAVNPVNGEVYLTLTNSNASMRPLNDTDAANPRHYTDPKLRPGFEDSDPNAQYNQSYGNPNGHIIRLRENGDNTAATSFAWDIYLFGANAPMDPENINLSQLTAENDFSSPDGLYFARPQNPAGQIKPLLWVQTDDGAYTDVTHNQMLAALPGTVGDGRRMTITNTAQNGDTAQQSTIVGAAATSATLKRFLVGPSESEITGIDSTPDGRTIFVGIQHPGEESDNPNQPSSNWPQSQSGNNTGRPRSAVVAITKNDGGVVGL